MRSSNSRIWLGIIFIAIGALLVIDNFNFFYFDMRHLIFSWHTFFLIAGIVILTRSKNSVWGIILLLIGLFGILRHIFSPILYVDFSDWWPIIIILIGLFIILRRNGASTTYRNAQADSKPYSDQQTQSSNFIDETSVFTSSKKIITSDNFCGGKITALVGSTKLDFSNSKLASGEHTLDITCLLGSCELIIPKDWKIIMNVTAIFGGFSDKRFISIGSTENSSGVLIIKGVVLFGGGEIYST